MEQQLLTYIEQELKRGVAGPMVKKALRDAGWGDIQIEEAFNEVQTKLAPPLPESEIARVEEIIPEEEEEDGVGKKKINKPIIIAALVFGAMILIVTALVSYFSLSTPSQIVEIEPEVAKQPVAETENREPKTVVEEPAAPADEDGVKLPPAIVEPATTTIATTTVATTTLSLDTVQGRDERRKSDMAKLVEAQKTWHQTTDQYYTCGLKSGDCKGKPFGYPAQIGKSLLITPQDPLAVQYLTKAPVCGKDYIYCGLNNSSYSQFFCYYAKLEGGGYYTASHGGNFTRKTAPKIFEECAAAN